MPQPDAARDNVPGSAAALADDLGAVFFDEEPLYATLYGVHDRDDRLGDVRTEAEQELRARYAGIAERARQLDVSAASPTDQVTRRVVEEVAAGAGDRLDAALVEITVTDLFVAHPAAMLAFIPYTTLTEPAHAGAYLDRLRALPAFLEAVAERQRAGAATGRTPVAHLARAAVAHVDRYLAAPDDDPLRTVAPPAGWDGADAWSVERDTILADVVRPAYRRYRDVVAEHLVPLGRPAERPGLSWLPDGEESYAKLVRYHTTTTLTPEQLHRTGVELIEGLAEEYAALGERALGTSTVGETFERLRHDPTLRFSTGQELLDAATAATRRAEQVAPQWFGRLPRAACTVEPFPPTEAPQSPAAAYMPGSPDGSRAGKYLVNTWQPQDRPRYDAEATAYHEAVPGHHFQLALAQELDELPLLRRTLPITAYSEGWGLYSERLADEMGLYSDDLTRVGMLTLDSLRASRLVVDTGLHALGWSRRRAVDYMVENTPLVRHEIEVEVDRYIADPGQALAYMVGRLEIQRIRAEAEAALGDRFDIRGFHDVVLGGGAVPLRVLADMVTDWAQQPL